MYASPSRTQPGQAFVLQVREGGETTCTCPAGAHGQPCKHAEALLIRVEAEQAILHLQAQERAQAQQQAQERQAHTQQAVRGAMQQAKGQRKPPPQQRNGARPNNELADQFQKLIQRTDKSDLWG